MVLGRSHYVTMIFSTVIATHYVQCVLHTRAVYLFGDRKKNQNYEDHMDNLRIIN